MLGPETFPGFLRVYRGYGGTILAFSQEVTASMKGFVEVTLASDSMNTRI
jgi:hypothetical protein